MSAVGGLLGLGRRFGRQTYTSTVVVRRRGADDRDEQTGKLKPSWTVVYVGPAEVKFGEARPRDVDPAGQRLAVQSPPFVRFPVEGEHAPAAALIRKDDVGEVTANVHDFGVIGLRFRVTGEHAQSNATARRLPVEVLSHA